MSRPDTLVQPSGRAAALAQFAADVQFYLSQEPRQLPSRYLYDALGSALFEAICRLPWYRITRAERRLLAAHGQDLSGRMASASGIVELGSGSGEKLRVLLEAAGRQPHRRQVHLVDLSPAALETAVRTLAPLERIEVTTHQAGYEAGLHEAAAAVGRTDRLLVLFLGSNIGNFDPPGASAFLCGIRGELRAGDLLLLGADLVKPERELRLAYDDPLGVTAAFNRNLLVRINRELGGDFDIDRFAHEAIWNAEESRIEMHLVARGAQHVRIANAGLEFDMADGERIWTESSYKYRPDALERLLAGAGFRRRAQWVDDPDQFALTFAEAV